MFAADSRLNRLTQVTLSLKRKYARAQIAWLQLRQSSACLLNILSLYYTTVFEADNSAFWGAPQLACDLVPAKTNHLSGHTVSVGAEQQVG
jgi:hypothetical protein